MSSSPWVARLSNLNVDALGPFRLLPDLEILEEKDSLWLRGQKLDEALFHKLREVPGIQFYFTLEESWLRRPVDQVPTVSLPVGEWVALCDWLEPELPPPAYGGRILARLQLQVVRGGPPCKAMVLISKLDSWHEYAIRAPGLRLKPLVFAVSTGGQTIIRGTPLPPLQGQRFVGAGQIVTPAGTVWSPSLDESVLKKLFDLEKEDLVLLHEDGTYDLVRRDHWVAATRAAVRATRGDSHGA